NLTVGKYQMEKGRWDSALSYLALSDDAQFKDLAAKELARPKEVTERIAIADDWWKLGDTEKTPLKNRFQAHAADLYKAALPSGTGPKKNKGKARLKEAAKLATGLGGKSQGLTGRNFTNTIGMKFNLIPVGEFMMGSPETEVDTQGRHSGN